MASFKAEVERMGENSHVRVWADGILTGCLVMTHGQADALAKKLNPETPEEWAERMDAQAAGCWG